MRVDGKYEKSSDETLIPGTFFTAAHGGSFLKKKIKSPGATKLSLKVRQKATKTQ